MLRNHHPHHGHSRSRRPSPTPTSENRDSAERSARKRRRGTRTPSPHRSPSLRSPGHRSRRHGHSRRHRTGSRSPSPKITSALSYKPQPKLKPRTTESNRIERLESLVKQLIKSQGSSGRTQASHDSTPNKNISDINCEPSPLLAFIPTFCPETSIISVNSWLCKIEELAEMHGWDEYTKINHMQSKLSGLAKNWFDNLTNYNHSWSSWKRLLKRAFPLCVDFAASLKEMLERVKLPDETMASYYFNKIELLHLCDIDGKKAVSCIIDGLQDTRIQINARAGNYESPHILYNKFLSTLEQVGKSTAVRPDSKPSSKSLSEETQRSKRSTSTVENNKEQEISVPNNVKCYNCQQRGHISAKCPMPLKECGVCNRLGHERETCPRNNMVFKTSSTKNQESVNETWDLEKAPCLRIDPPPTEVRELPRLGGKQWQSVNTSMRSLCEEAVDKVKQKIIHRRILLKPVFRDFDKHNNGHVSRNQMRQALRSNGILLSDEEVVALEERFNNDMGFNYVWFLKDVEPRPDEEPLYTNFVSDMKKLNKEPQRRKPTRLEQDIVQVMAKVKGKVVRERIRVMEFLRDFDKCKEQVISRENFKRGLSVCKLELTENEIETLMEVFASPMRRECVDYKRFSDVVEEAFTQQCLERAPLIVPIQHVPTRDCEKNFLNFDERRILSIALQKLAKKPDLQMNLSPVLQDFDKTNCGTVSVTNFLQALTLRGMNNLISSQEFDTICKCFSFERGMRNEVDYRAFMKALDILYATEKYNPF